MPTVIYVIVENCQYQYQCHKICIGVGIAVVVRVMHGTCRGRPVILQPRENVSKLVEAEIILALIWASITPLVTNNNKMTRWKPTFFIQWLIMLARRKIKVLILRWRRQPASNACCIKEKAGPNCANEASWGWGEAGVAGQLISM